MVNPQKWEIHWVDFSPAKGSEQDGHRPGIVVSNAIINNKSEVYMVIPLTRTKKGDKSLRFPTNVFVEKEKIYYDSQNIALLKKTGHSVSTSDDSAIVVNQMRPVAKERLHKKVGAISDWTIKNNINNAIKFLLNLDGCHNCNTPIRPESLKCFNCKIDVQKKCKKCSNIVPYTHLHCFKCGERV